MKIHIYSIESELICVPGLVYMIAFGLQYGAAVYLGGPNRVGIPTNQEDWILFITVLIISLFLIGRRYTICENGIEVNQLFGLMKKRYTWSEFHYVGCHLSVDKEKANLKDPNDYVIFLKKRKPRLDCEWYLSITSDCSFHCYPTLYLIIQSLAPQICRPLPFSVGVPLRKNTHSSNTLKKWHFVCLGYALFCLMAAYLTMWYELHIVLDVFIWGIVIIFEVIFWKEKGQLQKLNEAAFQCFWAYLEERKHIGNDHRCGK